MGIDPGAIYWLQLQTTAELEPRIPHPHVVIQVNDTSVTACALTSNLQRVNLPGNVLLDVGEANLSRQSVVEVSKVVTVDQAQLGEYIGSLTEQRIDQILAGIRFIQKSYFER